MRADHGAICDGSRLVYVDLKIPEDLRPAVLVRPVAEAVVDALPVPEAFGQISPLDPCFRAEDDRIDEHAIAQR